WPKCWETIYCKPAIREMCPTFLAKKPCWKRKVGCYCDDDLIQRALGMQKRYDVALTDVRENPAYNPRPQLSNAEKRARCRRCVIYLDHQRSKYKLFSPLIIPAVAAALFVSAPFLKTKVIYGV